MKRLRRVMTCTPLRVMSWLLIASLVFAGLPTLEIHAHADAVGVQQDHPGLDHDHHHDGSRASAADDLSAPELQLHVHESTTLAFVPAAFIPITLGAGPFDAPPMPVLVRPGAALTPPLQRPPIA